MSYQSQPADTPVDVAAIAFRTRLAAGIFTLAVTAALAACGGGGSAETDTAAVQVEPVAAATTEAMVDSSEATAQAIKAVKPPVASGSVVNTNLLPQVINPLVTTAFESHIAMTPASNVTAAHKLLVFLPGTGAIPSNYKMILVEGAAKGYHAIGLNYPNAQPIGTICGNYYAEPNCFWDVRREVILGQDLSSNIVVAGPDSIVTRLTNLLTYLSATSSSQAWNQYLLPNGTVDWSKIVISGHSQGGGHAGVMAKMFAMHRACYFDSPPDWNLFTSMPAPWETYANVTPASAQFGFTNTQDTLVPYNELSSIWQAMGVSAFGGPVSVDTTAAPYANSHWLTTAAPSATTSGNQGDHGTTIVDVYTPRNASGGAVFAPVWDAACFQ